MLLGSGRALTTALWPVQKADGLEGKEYILFCTPMVCTVGVRRREHVEKMTCIQNTTYHKCSSTNQGFKLNQFVATRSCLIL